MPDGPQEAKIKRSEKWYAEGLHFSCTGCGNCCTGPSGYVGFEEDELGAMADYLGLTVAQFTKKHTRRLGKRLSLDETRTQHGYDCVFLERDEASGKALCSIYPVRPRQCRSWPFWPENLKSFRAYVNATRTCPGTIEGLHGKGTFFPVEKIRVLRDSTPK